MFLRSLTTAILAYTSRLRFPALLALSAALFIADLLVPDLIPIADELVLGLVTAGLASWKKQKHEIRGGGEPEIRDVTPP